MRIASKKVRVAYRLRPDLAKEVEKTARLKEYGGELTAVVEEALDVFFNRGVDPLTWKRIEGASRVSRMDTNTVLNALLDKYGSELKKPRRG